MNPITSSLWLRLNFIEITLGSAHRIREPTKKLEHQWLTLQIVGFNVARSGIDLLPHLRQPIATQWIGGLGIEPAREPAVQDVHERGQACRVGAIEPVAEGVPAA